MLARWRSFHIVPATTHCRGYQLSKRRKRCLLELEAGARSRSSKRGHGLLDQPVLQVVLELAPRECVTCTLGAGASSLRARAPAGLQQD